MAFIKKDGNSMGLPMNITRSNPIPLDASEVYYSYEEAEAYAKSGKVAYVGQIIVVVNEGDKNAKSYQIQDTEGTLKEVGSTSLTHIVETKAGLIELSDAKVGEQAFVKESGENGGMYILTADPPTSEENWSKVSSDVTWSSGAKINFVATTYSQFKGLPSKDNNTLYVVSDIGKIYKGQTDVTQCVSLVENEEAIPEAESAAPGTIYIAKDSYVIKVLDSGTSELVTVLPGYVTDGTNWSQTTDDSKLVTLGVVKTKLNEEIQKITSQIEGAKVTTVTNIFTEGKLKTSIHQGESDIDSDEVELTGVAHTPTYEGQKLTINVYGSQPVEVDFTEMLKDKFLSSATYEASYDPSSHEQANPELSGKPVIIFTVTGSEAPLVVDVSSLVDTYKSGSQEGDVITVTVAEDKISAKLNITSSADGSLVTTDAEGKLVAKTVEDAVGSAITDAINAALGSGALKDALDKKMNTLEEGNEDEVILSGADGAVKRSGKKLGDTTLSESGDDLVAMESAVIAALTLGTIE